MPSRGHRVWVLIALLISPVMANDAPYSVADALSAFRVAPGFTVALVAAEPDVIDPVEMAFDARGRLFVVEMRDYPTGPMADIPPVGCIALLTDEDGDGRFTRKATFAKNLAFPTGVLPANGGLFVTCAPDILFFKDTDGDGVADQRRVMFTGFATKNTQLRVNHPRLGMDNWIYVANGLRGGTVTIPANAAGEPIPIPRMDFRFRPDASRYEATAGFAQFGLTFNDQGQQFVCSNRNPIKHVVLRARHLQRNPHFAFSQTEVDIPEEGIPVKVFPISNAKTTALSHAGTFTAACGVTVYRGDLFPEPFHGNAFICEPTGNLVHRDLLVPDGPSFIARRARPGVEFLASPDTWFRPVNLANGPDGAFYVVDMVRKTIEHPQWLAEAVRRVTDFESGKSHGRLWRIAPTGAPHRQVDWPGRMDTAQLVGLLGHPNAWQRMTAQRLLVERRDPAAVKRLRKALRSSASPLGRLHALHTLDGFEAVTIKTLETALDDADAACRYHGVQLAEPWLAKSPDLRRRVLGLARDDDCRVRFQVALAIGGLDDEKVVDALAEIITRDAEYRWSRVAVLTALTGRAERLLTKLADAGRSFLQQDSAGHAAFLYELGVLAAIECNDSTVRGFVSRFAAGGGQSCLRSTMAVVTGLATGLERRPTQRTTLPHVADGLAALDTLFKKAVNLAGNNDAAVGSRLAATRLLRYAPYEVCAETLLKLMHPQQPHAIQFAAVSAFGRLSDPRVATALVDGDRWRAYSPAVRAEALSMLTRRPERIAALLDAVEAGDVQPWSIDAGRRTRLLKHPNKELRARAARLLADGGASDRHKVYEAYLPILKMPADGKRGKLVFGKQCAICHLLEDQGAAVGPDLFSVRNRAKETLLLHVLVPNEAVVPEYTNYVIETKDRQVITGVIASETPTSVTLRRAQSAEDTILRSNIESMYSSSLSIMPQELERNMSKQELADLMEYLRNGTGK